MPGTRIVVITRPADQAASFAANLESRGVSSLSLPVIGIETAPADAPARAALNDLDSYQWLVFASANSARCLAELLVDCGQSASIPRGCLLAAQGEATAAAIQQAFGRPADLLPTVRTSAGLLEKLAGLDLRQAKILLPISEIGGETLPEGLRRLGARVCCLEVYRNVALPLDRAQIERLAEVDAACVIFSFFSPSAFHSLLASLRAGGREGLLASAKIASIGPVTTHAIKEAGFRVDIEPTVQTQEALIEAILAF